MQKVDISHGAIQIQGSITDYNPLDAMQKTTPGNLARVRYALEQ